MPKILPRVAQRRDYYTPRDLAGVLRCSERHLRRRLRRWQPAHGLEWWRLSAQEAAAFLAYSRTRPQRARGRWPLAPASGPVDVTLELLSTLAQSQGGAQVLEEVAP